MRNKQAVAGVPSRYLHLDAHQSRQMAVRFPGSVGAAGDRVVLRLSGGYRGGTFGASFRVTLP